MSGAPAPVNNAIQWAMGITPAGPMPRRPEGGLGTGVRVYSRVDVPTVNTPISLTQPTRPRAPPPVSTEREGVYPARQLVQNSTQYYAGRGLAVFLSPPQVLARPLQGEGC